MKDKKIPNATPRFVVAYNDKPFFDGYLDLKGVVGMALSLHETSNVPHVVAVYSSSSAKSGEPFISLVRNE